MAVASPRWAERRLKGFGDVKEVLEKMLQERYAPRTQTLTHWTYAASTCTGNRGLKSRLSLPAMSLRRHW
jgi:hypothetical protein